MILYGDNKIQACYTEYNMPMNWFNEIVMPDEFLNWKNKLLFGADNSFLVQVIDLMQFDY
jgi:hypothetical protein